MFILTTFSLGASNAKTKLKASDDPCPKGTHEVLITEEFRFAELVNKKEKVTAVKETRKVCRDNKDSGLEENTKNK